MNHGRQKVARPVVLVDALIVAAALGTFVGACIVAALDSQTISMVAMMITCGVVPDVALPLVIVIPFAEYLARRCQRVLTVWLTGFVFGMALVIVISSFHPLFPIQSTLTHSIVAWLLVSMLLALIGGVGFATVNVAFGAFNRAIRFVAVEHDGTRCWRCAYPLHSPPVSPRCPECGYSIASQPRVRPAPRRGRSLLRVAGAALIMLLVGVGAVRTALAMQRQASIVAATAPGSAPWGVPMIRVETTGGSTSVVGFWDARCTFRAVEDRSDLCIGVCFDPRPERGQPSIQLLVLNGNVTPAATSLWGNPPIICNLDSSLEAIVFEHGIPDSLIAEMVERADEAGWAPLGPGSPWGPVILVSPDSHFANEPSDP